MRRLVVLLTMLAFGSVLGTPPAAAQSLLERLERRLNNLNQELAPPGSAPAVPPTETQPGVGQPGAGQAERGYLGLIADDAGEMGRGVRVLSVKADSPAEAAGLRDGDLLVAIDGQPVRQLSDMADRLRNARAGQKLRFDFERDGQAGEVQVTLARRQGDPAAPDVPSLEAELGPPLAGAGAVKPQLGVTVVELTDAARQRYGLNVARGALVSSIRSGSPADRAGVPLGAAIVSLDGERIESPADLAEVVGKQRVGTRVELAYYAGEQLVRKSIDLTEVAQPDPPDLPRLTPRPAEDPALRLGRGRTDRPLLGRLEQALGGLVDPQGTAPPGPATEVDRLRQEVEALRRHISRLEERLSQLEQRVGEN